MSDLPLPAWLLEALGVDLEALEGGSAHLRFVRFPEGELGLLAILGVAAAIAIVVWTYLNEGKLARAKKLALAAVRGLTIAVLSLVVFYPVLEVDRSRELRAVTAVLLDESLSLGIEDRYQGAPEDAQRTAEALGLDLPQLAASSRAQLVERFLADERVRFLARLAEKNRVETYVFARELRPLASEKVRIEPHGPATDLAGALRSAIEQQGGARVAGVVVFTDGRVTAGPGLSSVAPFLRERQVPVHAVGIGDPTPPRNLRVTTFLASERVFAGDPVAIDVTVSEKGYDGETIQVELLDERLEGGAAGAGGADTGAGSAAARVLETVEVTFEEGRDEAVAHFTLDLEGVGRHRLTARVALRAEEAFADDNERTADVEVIEEASHVLVISGGPSWEYRFLQNLLRRDRRVSVSAWLQSADVDFPQEGDVSLKKLPTDAKDLFAYDVVILLDPDPADLPGGYPQLLERFVGEQSGGLVFVAGEKYTARFFQSQEMKPLWEVLPVVADLSRAESHGGASFAVQEWPLVPTPLASSHSSTRLSSRPERNRERWEELPGIYWSFPVRKAKAGANVLLVHSDPSRRSAEGDEPVLAWQFYAGGRAFFLASDETWRWRATTEEIYDQFWMQTVRYLTEGRLQGGKRRLLQLDRDAYELGDAVRVSALLQDEDFRPVVADFQIAIVSGPDGEDTELRLEKDENAPGWFRGVFVPRALGGYRLRLADGTEAALRVEPPEVEFQEPQLDEAALKELAQRTGGSFARLWEAAAVPDRIPDARQTVVTTDDPIPLWDNWIALTVLSSLLTIEWVLRKLVRLL
jgi:hypothetical protein